MNEVRQLTAEQIQQILSNIERIEVADLIKYVISGQIPFDDMKATGKLARVKQDEIIKALEAEEAKNEVETDYWHQVQSTNTIAAYEEYCGVYPNGKHISMAQGKINHLINVNEQKKHGVLMDIQNNPDGYPPRRLQDLFDDRIITPDDLFENDIINPAALNLYLNPPIFFTEQSTWKDLAALPIGNTDVYFFGIPRSGKSSILAGVLYKADQLGKLSVDVHNSKGVKYMNELKRGVEVGYVPPSTSTDQVNYISSSFISDKREHPLSIIEMSGEFFNRTYENDETGAKQSVGAKGYLHNTNRKVLFFIIDYHKHTIGTEHSDIATQKDILIYVLKKLEQDGTLKKTDSIQIIVTKSDLMPNDVDNNQYTKDFLEANYLSLVNEIRKVNKKYGINNSRNNNIVVHPFSLGKFMLGKTFIYDGTDSERILDSLINLTSHKREKKFWEKLR